MRKQKFGLENVRIHSGDVVVLYTDGITEAMNKDNEVYGEEKLIGMIKKLHLLDAKEIAYAILEDVQKFTAESRYGDDRTIVVIKRDPKPQSEIKQTITKE
jgi:serine phosphatase RsbU (regulator of sigma subunit)